jgi:hypothetical protein
MSYDEIIQKIKEGKSIEVNYDNAGIVLNEYKALYSFNTIPALS